MKKLTTTLLLCCLALLVTFGLAACGNKSCNQHTYDNACDTICNECEEERTITHAWGAEDHDCETAVVCSVCQAVATEAKQHDFADEWQKDEDGHYHACQNDGCENNDGKTEHTGGTATCLIGKICEICDYEYTAPDTENHNFVNNVCACGDKIQITGLTYAGGDRYIYDESTNTYTLAIHPKGIGVDAFFKLTIENFEHLQADDTLLMLKETNNFLGERIITADLIVDRTELIFGWGNLQTEEWLEFSYSNDGGSTWSETIKVDVKQAYQINQRELESASVTIDKEYAIPDETVSLTLSIQEGFKFGIWLVTDADGNPVTVTDNQFIMPESSVTINADIITEIQLITVNSSQNGSVSADKSFAHENEKITLTISPDEGYTLDTLTITDRFGKNIEFERKTANDYCFSMPYFKVAVTATFKVCEEHEFFDGKCVCGFEAPIAVTAGESKLYVITTEQLNVAMTTVILAGNTDVSVKLPENAPAEAFTAIRRALIDTYHEKGIFVNLEITGATAIPDDAFSCIAYDESGNYIGEEYIHALKSISLPDALMIGPFAFYSCLSLQSLYAPKVQIVGTLAFQNSKITSLYLPETTEIKESAFESCFNLISIKLPKATQIKDYAFCSCPELKTVELLAENDILLGNKVFDESVMHAALLLHSNKASQTDNRTYGGYTFASIEYLCADGTTNHSYTTTLKNRDFTHTQSCSICNAEKIEKCHAENTPDKELGTCAVCDNILWKYDQSIDTYTVYHEDGFRFAVISGGTILLANDITITLSTNTEATVTIDLNGKTVNGLKYGYDVISDGNVTVKDSVGNGKYNAKFLITGTFVMENGYVFHLQTVSLTANATVKDGTVAEVVCNGGTISLQGGTFTERLSELEYLNATIIITGGTFFKDPTAYVDTNEYTVTKTNDVYTVTKKTAE